MLPVPEIPLQIPLHIPFLDRFTLVCKFLALAQTYLNLDPALPEVEVQRNQCIALFTDPSLKPFEFMGMHEQLAWSIGIMVKNRAVGIFGNMDIPQPKFAFFYNGVAIGEGNLAHTKGFDFRAKQHDAALEVFLNCVVEARPPVQGDDLDAVHDSVPCRNQGKPETSIGIAGFGTHRPPRIQVDKVSAVGP